MSLNIIIAGSTYYEGEEGLSEAQDKHPWYVGLPPRNYTDNCPVKLEYYGFATMDERDKFSYGWRVGGSEGNGSKYWDLVQYGNWKTGDWWSTAKALQIEKEEARALKKLETDILFPEEE